MTDAPYRPPLDRPSSRAAFADGDPRAEAWAQWQRHVDAGRIGGAKPPPAGAEDPAVAGDAGRTAVESGD